MPLKDIHIDISVAKPTPKTGLGTPLFVIKDTGESPAGDVYGKYSSIEAFKADSNFASIKDNVVLNQKLNTLMNQENRPKYFCVLSYATDATVALNNVWDNDFYFLLSGDDLTESQAAIANAVDLKDFKIAVIQTKRIADLGAYNSKHRVIEYYQPNDGEHLDAASVGSIGSLTVGSVTWKFKDVKMVTPTPLTQTEMDQIDAKRAIAFTPKYGHNELTEGWTCYVQGLEAPEYIDDIHGQDWILTDMTQGLADLMYNTPKLPYDQRGISALQATAEITLKRGYDQGIVGITADGLPAYTVSALTKEDQDEDDILNRRYRGLQWSYGRSGAIHEVWVQGEITY